MMRRCRAYAGIAVVALVGCKDSSSNSSNITPTGDDGTAACPPMECPPSDDSQQDLLDRIAAGRETFRFDTFGDEAFWGDTLKLHKAIAGAANGGVGPGVSPKTALAVGLKVDMDALPGDVVTGIQNGSISLDDPATTVALLKLDAVVGVTGFFTGDKLTSMGIQCALCHSTVDDAFAPGVGHRLDGWPNRDLDVGKIITLAPDLSAFTELLGVSAATVRTVLLAWGPGKFDAELILDGKGFRPDGKTAATLIPPAFGQAGLALHTYTGWGSTPYWNAFVAVLEMHGKGNFFDPRLDDAAKFPIAARERFGHIRVEEDRVSGKLPDLHLYQITLEPPAAPEGTFDSAAAMRGHKLFSGKAHCTNCHFDDLFTEAGWPMHTPEQIGIDSFQADRSPDERYRTTPLRGMVARMKGGLYHDGRFATLLDVVNHYNTFMRLGLTNREKADLVEYLKSL